MNRMSTVLKIHYQDKWSWIYIPTLILFGSFSVNLIFSSLVSRQGEFYTGGVTSIFIYMFVAGILVVAQSFPFAIGMSIRRVDYFIGTAAMGMISSIVFGSLVFFLSLLEKQTNGWGTVLHYFHFPYMNDGSALEQFSMYMIIFAYLFFSGFLIMSFAHRFGGKGMIISALVFMIFGSIAGFFLHHFDALESIFNWFAGKTAVQIAYWLVPFLLINAIVSYLLLRRATV